MTRIGDEHLAVAPQVDVASTLSEQEIAGVAWLVVAINGWNRIAITSQFPVAP